MEENIFDLVNNFDSFEESFDGIGEDSFTNSFDEMNDDFAQNPENGFFGEEENSFFGNDEIESNNENLDSEPTLGSSVGGFFSPTPVWKKAGIEGIAPNCGAHDDYDHDGWENWEDNYDGPGRHMYDYAKPRIPSFFGSSLGGVSEMTGSDHESISISEIIDNFPDYEEIDFNEIFENVVADFMLGEDFPEENLSSFSETEDHFHQQEQDMSCAVAVQTDILRDFGVNVSEEEMREYGKECGIFSETEGTRLEHVGDLLEKYNIPVERTCFDPDDMENNIRCLLEAKANGEKVIIGVDAGILNHSFVTSGHAIEFKDITNDCYGNVYVQVDDPAFPNGQNAPIPLHDFCEAWGRYGCFSAITRTNS